MLGTLVEIRVPEAEGAPSAFELAFAAIERVHHFMSRQASDSDVSRINRAAAGERVAVDRWTWDVLRRAKELRRATGGLFDCAVHSSFEDLELAGEARVFLRQRVTISLDGIAKGYAVDRAVAALRHAGVVGGVVNAGGDLRVFGDEPQTVHVRHPRAPGRFVQIGALREAAVATSGRYFGNSSLIDPRTHRTKQTSWSATVVAGDCTTADALTKPCLLDRRRAASFAAACGAHSILLH